jgi:Ca-activated chloride channel family protein
MMNDFKLLPEDPKLTAYALGELDDEERVAVERVLRDDPAARASVEEVRALAAELETAFGAEPAAVIVPFQPATDPYGAAARRKSERSPNILYMVGGLAAACFAVVLALQDAPVRKAPEKLYYEVQMPAVAASMSELVAAEVEEGEAMAEDSSGGGLTLSPAGASTIAGLPTGLLEQTARPFTFSEEAANTSSADKWRGGAADYVEPRVTRQKPRYASGRDVNLPKGDVAVSNEFTASAHNVSLEGPRTYGAVRFQRIFSTGARAPLVGNTENYTYRRESDFLPAREHPLSTFSADVDTASYANMRRFLMAAQLPPVDAVRIEELLNTFSYGYAAPSGELRDGKAPPFAATMEVADAPWAPGHRLVWIGLKGREVATAARERANLVFLLDVSGSMNQSNKLPLVKESMRLLVSQLRADDRVAIVTYAGASGLALPSTPVSKSREILAAIEELHPGGATNGAMGIQLAYDIAKANAVSGGINRVILCTDGDFNVGIADEGGLVRLIEEKAKSGVFLTVLGFGMGNLKDSTMQQLANRGNGTYGYVDTRREAEKLLVQQVSGTLVTIAKDVKLQVEFNPAQVASYRLLGYEKRALQAGDFNNDAVDAGEIGAGHTVTALYEIVPVGAVGNAHHNAETGREVDELKYAPAKAKSSELAVEINEQDEGGEGGASAAGGIVKELLTLKVRYKEPDGTVSEKLEFVLVDEGRSFAAASDDFKFAAAVAGFGMLLRDSPHKGLATFSMVREWAESGSGHDHGGHRTEFIDLVQRAEALR